MERDFYTDEFEQLIKEKSDQFRMYPSKRVWHSIYNNLHPSRRWPSFAISILFLTSLPTIGYLNTGDNARINQSSVDKSTRSVAVNIFNKNNKSTLTNKPIASTSANTALYKTSTHLTKSNSAALNDEFNQNGNIAGISKEKNQDKLMAAKNKNNGILQQLDNDQELFIIAGDANNTNTLKGTKQGGDTQTNNKEFNGKDDEPLSKTESTINTLIQSPVSSGTVAAMDKSIVTENRNKNIPKTTKTGVYHDAQEEKSWIENYALQNKPASSKWKDRLDFEFYATPAVNYRKLTTESKGSVAPFATTGDINKSISQKPGLGIETGVGISYAFAKNLRLKAGLQFNYTNYNINADQTNHPIQTSILLTDPSTGFSYPAPRTSTLANTYDNNALQPVTLHNRTYQVSIPVGLAYKLSSHKNVEWFAGATVQPSYIFGGKAHLISSDLKNYISDPSTIRNWNLNIGFETYMNYKLGAYNLRIGPQVRYQVYSTYRKDVALIEKPYAVGLKIGIIKGF